MSYTNENYDDAFAYFDAIQNNKTLKRMLGSKYDEAVLACKIAKTAILEKQSRDNEAPVVLSSVSNGTWLWNNSTKRYVLVIDEKDECGNSLSDDELFVYQKL